MASYVLSPRQYRQIKTAVIDYIKPELVGRRFIPRDPEVGPGAQEVTRTSLDAPDEKAKVIAKGEPYPLVTPTEQEVTVYIRKIGAAFSVTDEDLESSRVNGRPLDRQSIAIASRLIQEWEDSFIFNGYARVNETGVLGKATNTTGASAKWDTGSCEPYEDVNEAVGKLEADGFKAQFLILNNEDIKYLRKEDTFGNIYKDKVINNLGIPDERILSSNTLTKGTGLVCDSGPQIAELKEVEPITVLPPVRTVNDTQQINIRERIGIDVYQTDAFCTITTIS